MEQLLELVINVLELGFIYSLVGLAVYFSTQIIKIDDLSIEESFPLGGALTAVLLQSQVNPILSLLIVLVAGALVGWTTGMLHARLNLSVLTSGIVVTTMLFSLNLKMAGPHASIASTATIFDLFSVSAIEKLELLHLAVLGPLCLIMFVLVPWLLKTELGLCLRAVGGNALVLTHLGKDIAHYKIIGLMITNAIAAYAGSLFVQHTGFFSITGSIGTMVIAFAGLILGSGLCQGRWLGILSGAMVYQIIIALAIELQVDPVWNKLITGLLIVALISTRRRGQPTPVLANTYGEENL